MRRPAPMVDLTKLPSRGEGCVHVVIETPRGSREKLAYDPALGAVVVSRPLTAGLAYPYDWGFVPRTLAPDGDPLDAMVLSEHARYPGVVVPSRAIGAVLVTQRRKSGRGRERNDRVVFVPSGSSLHAGVRSVTAREREELERFFALAVVTEDKVLTIEGWADAEAAEALIADAERAWKRRHAARSRHT